MLKILYCLTLIYGCVLSATIIEKSTETIPFILNDRPIIGVLSQEMSYHLDGKYPDMYKSFIAASYVKFIEGGGGRVVPIWINKTKPYYENIMSNINGILFPGGATYFNNSNGYAEAGRYIYEIAIDMNNRGDFMPLWGTCLGLELLTYLAANGREHRSECNSYQQTLSLKFKTNYRNSKLFNNAPNDIIEILTNENVTSNFHRFCITEKNLTDFGLNTDWLVISTNNDFNNFQFISILEHKTYPFYGVQFHPEKNIYEWVLNKNISHTSNAIKANQYFAEFFVNEARKSSNQFINTIKENQHLIYNFPTTFTALVKSIYLQCYFFEAEIDYNKDNNLENEKQLRLINALGEEF